jgi:hypothetical protein
MCSGSVSVVHVQSVHGAYNVLCRIRTTNDYTFTELMDMLLMYDRVNTGKIFQTEAIQIIKHFSRLIIDSDWNI